METFGGCKLGREIDLGPNSAVYSAEGGIGRMPKGVAVKLCYAIGEEKSAEFLQSVAEQKRAVSNGCKWFVPIYSDGTENERPYYITKRVARSVKTLIRGRVVVGSPGLLHFGTQVIKALRDLKKKCSRSHGNLKATNILLDGKGRLRNMQVYLSDPAPVASEADVAQDLYQLGLLICQLARRRELSMTDWPVNKTPEWNALGNTGDDWLQFCNFLLDPKLSETGDPLLQAEIKLRAIRRKQGLLGFTESERVKRAALFLVALAVIGGGAMEGFKLWHGKSRNGKPVPVGASEAWIEAMVKELKKQPAWSPPPELQELRKISNQDSKAQRNQQLQEYLFNWQTRITVEKEFGSFEARGWSHPVCSLAGGEGMPGADNVLQQIDEIRSVNNALSNVEQNWGLIEQSLSELSAFDKKLQTIARNYALGTSAEASKSRDLQKLTDRLENLNNELGDIKRFLKEKSIDFERFGHVAIPEQCTLGQWRQKADEYVRLDASGDTREKLKQRIVEIKSLVGGLNRSDLNAGIEGVKLDIQGVDRDINELPPQLVKVDSVKLDRIERSISLINQKAQRLANAPPPGQPQALPESTPGISENTGDLGAKLNKFKEDIAAATDVQTARTAFEAFRQAAPQQVKVLKAIDDLFNTKSLEFASLKNHGWQLVFADKEVAAYDYKGTTLCFRLVQPPGEKPYCLSVTEIPVGLVAAWSRNRSGAPLQAPRPGPTSWILSNNQIALNSNWMRGWTEGWAAAWKVIFSSDYPYYSSNRGNVKPSEISGNTPMNNISPRDAQRIASDLGAELPTVQDWKFANSYAEQTQNLNKQGSLRGSVWERYCQIVEDNISAYKAKAGRLPGTGSPPWPSGYYSAGPVNPTAEATKINSGENEESLWPQRVDGADGTVNYEHYREKLSDIPFCDLKGNVAEIVRDAKDNSVFYVIGGSVLSPPQQDWKTESRLNNLAFGYTDVGFRLVIRDDSGFQPNIENIKKFVSNLK